MHVASEAIVCAVRSHGETGTIARLLTPRDGLLAGYVRGGRSRRLRPVLQPGNLVEADYRARTDEQLPALTVELTRSRAPLSAEPLAAAAIEWACALTATSLAEALAYPALFSALDGLLAAIEAAPSARGWAPALVRYELLLLAELGFGLDLSACAVTGVREDLAFVSPKSGMAVSRSAGEPYRDRLLPLPDFVLDRGSSEWIDVVAALRLTGHFVARDLVGFRRDALLAARARLVERFTRLAG